MSTPGLSVIVPALDEAAGIEASLRATNSGRRWKTHGVWRTILLIWRLRLRYRRGAPAELLAKEYRR